MRKSSQSLLRTIMISGEEVEHSSHVQQNHRSATCHTHTIPPKLAQSVHSSFAYNSKGSDRGNVRLQEAVGMSAVLTTVYVPGPAIIVNTYPVQ